MVTIILLERYQYFCTGTIPLHIRFSALRDPSAKSHADEITPVVFTRIWLNTDISCVKTNK